jgi:hypothetical protein
MICLYLDYLGLIETPVVFLIYNEDFVLLLAVIGLGFPPYRSNDFNVIIIPAYLL